MISGHHRMARGLQPQAVAAHPSGTRAARAPREGQYNLSMRLCFTTRKLTSWMATLAILMVALAPSFLHAMAPKQLPIPSEICVSTGVRQVQLGASPEQSPPPQDLHHFEHCPCCSVHGHAVALPSVVSSRPLLLSCAHELPRTFLAAPRTPHAWVAAKPRGPPAFA